MEKVEKSKETGKTSKENPEYKKIHTRISNLRQYFSPNYRYKKNLSTIKKEALKERLKEIKNLEKTRAKIRSTIPSTGHRIYYVRYADDFLIGINGPKGVAMKLREEIGEFLRNTLKLELNMEKNQDNFSHQM